MSRITADQIQVAYLDKIIIDQLSLEILDGKVTTIIGANGCGKSTLLKALSRILPLNQGSIFLDGQTLTSLPTKEVAKKLALLPQGMEATEGITVYELVSYGRFPHQNGLGRLTATDRNKINWAMTATKITHLANQQVDSLSGGQRQKVWIAMALAQDTEIIFLDEPTTYLDLNHQLEVLELLQDLNQTTGKTIVMVLHDLNQSARFSDQIIAMKSGQISHQGRADEVIRPEILREIFEIEATIVTDPQTQRPALLSYHLLTK